MATQNPQRDYRETLIRQAALVRPRRKDNELLTASIQALKKTSPDLFRIRRHPA